MQSPDADPILARSRASLHEVYGSRFERVALYLDGAWGERPPPMREIRADGVDM